MNKPNPSKRRSLRENTPHEEIVDNVKNNARITRSKTLEKAQQEMLQQDKSDENGLSALSSDEEELLNDAQKRLSSEEQLTYLRHRSQGKENASSGSEEVDLSRSPSRDISYNVELEARNTSRQQRKKKGKIVPLPDSEKKQNIKNKDSVKNNINIAITQSQNNSGCNPCFIFLLIIFLVWVGSLYFYKKVPDSEEDVTVKVLKCGRDDLKCIKDDVKRTLKSMKAKYTHQDDNLWPGVLSGIMDIINNPKKPSIIVLLGDKTETLNCLAVLLGNVSSNALSSGLLKLTPEKFENDMGTVITSLRHSIEDKKAVIVWDLLNINEEALKAFHNLCDRINPLVEEVIYIITIIADDYNEKMSPLEFVEKKLYKKLSGKMKEDAIQPLITRITDGAILKVNPEPNVIDCPLPKVVK